VTRLEAEVVPGGGTLARPVSNAQASYYERRGLILRLFDENRTLGQGEASPLPDFSADGLEGAASALQEFSERPLDFDLEQPLDALLAEAGCRLPAAQAAARFAVETALLDLVGQRCGKPLWFLLRSLGSELDPAAARLPLCSLVDMTSEEHALRASEAAIERGVGSLKLKVGRPGARVLELRIALALRAAFGSMLRLRFDANRAWSASEALARLQELAQVDPEFVEEALDPSALAGLGRLPAPLALDESLLSADWLKNQGLELVRHGLTAVVLKPMLLGGFSRCLALSSRAKSLGLRVVVSHLFDGPIALAASAALGLATASIDCASGLDRHPGLECWPSVSLPMVSESEVVPLATPGLGLQALATGAP
jgi:o-succinylbenzoate synthase